MCDKVGDLWYVCMDLGKRRGLVIGIWPASIHTPAGRGFFWYRDHLLTV